MTQLKCLFGPLGGLPRGGSVGVREERAGVQLRDLRVGQRQLMGDHSAVVWTVAILLHIGVWQVVVWESQW